MEAVEPHAIDHNTSFTGGEDASATARWAVSKAGENFAFLVTLPDVKRNYTFVTRRYVKIEDVSLLERSEGVVFSGVGV